MMIRKRHIHSDLAIPPGEYLEEVISELGMTKMELARRMNRPATKLSSIFTGDKTITPDTALQLEKVVGVPAHIWTGLEAEYRLTLARNNEIKSMYEETNLITKFCYSKLVELGLVDHKTKILEKVQELRHFFGVTSLKNIQLLKRYEAVFRQGKGKVSPEVNSAWLRIGEIEGQKADSAIFKKDTLEKALPSIRSMTRMAPEEFKTNLCKILLDAGIVLVFSPYLPKTHLQGATFWMGQTKAVLMLTNRGKWADIFWFTLFHEIGHLLLHSKSMVFLESEEKMELDEREMEADNFAKNILIPPDKYKIFIEAESFYPENIKIFAADLGIDPGIVVGRLQHDGIIKNSWLNDIRSKYEWGNITT